MIYEVEFPSLKKLVNKPFHSIFENRDRYLFLWGGRDSGKSVSARRKLIFRCLSEKYFRCILIRNTYESIRDSQYQGIIDDIQNLGLSQLFTNTVNPLEIKCINGNKFLCRGLDKPEKLKSLENPSAIWYEEGNQITEQAFLTITTSVRSSEAEYIQELMTFNPESECNYEDFWLYKMFFQDTVEKNFRKKVEINVEGKVEYYYFTSIHSTYHDNPYCTYERKLILEKLKKTNPYYYTIYTLGEWGNRDVSSRFFKSFNRLFHVGNVGIDLSVPIHISFDENVNPYPALTIWQFNEVKKTICQIHEICLTTPNNKLKKVASTLCSWMRKNSYFDIVFIHGDATSDREDSKLEQGVNYFTMLKSEIEQSGWKCRIKKPNKNPSVALSGEFINSLLEGYDGYSILIDESCKTSITDYLMVTETTNGSMKKQKNKDGVEIYGHCSDTFRYFIVSILDNVMGKYQRNNVTSKYLIENIPDRSY